MPVLTVDGALRSCGSRISVRELQRLNSLQSDFIVEGDVLVVTNGGWAVTDC